MKEYSCTIFVNILLLIGVVYLFCKCSNDRNVYNSNTTHANYEINHYIDTIGGHIILTTVCNNINRISVSTLELKD